MMRRRLNAHELQLLCATCTIWEEQPWSSTVAIGQDENGDYSASFGYKKRSRFGSGEVGKKKWQEVCSLMLKHE